MRGGAWDGSAAAGQPLWVPVPGSTPRSRGEQRQLPTARLDRGAANLTLQPGERDAVSREVTRGVGRTRSAQNPLCTPRGPARSLRSLSLRPPGKGLTWAAQSLPPPAARPAPRSPAPPALAMSRAAGSAALLALLVPGPATVPLAGADSPGAAPRAPARIPRPPPPQPPPPRRSLPLP